MANCGPFVATTQELFCIVATMWLQLLEIRGKPMKTDLLKVRVSKAEKDAFQTAADIAGIAVSAWARERLRRAAVRDLQDASRPIPFLEKLNGNR